jgi:heptosyltransferase-2
MKILIIKLGASGDVVRTTTLLHLLNGEISWLVSDKNAELLGNISQISECFKWSDNHDLKGRDYDLVINLEDSLEVGYLLNNIKYKNIFGAHLNSSDTLTYTQDSKQWFDLSLISSYGREKADKMKFLNRRSYQEIVFEGLGGKFNGERYFLPKSVKTDLHGDIAIAHQSGTVWPIKNWAYYEYLKEKLEKDGFKVNYLPIRDSLLEHIGDVQNHKYLIGGDSLPMHIAFGSNIYSTIIYTCTSPWEIYDYGIQNKIVSPQLGKYFYQRKFDKKATTIIPLDLVYKAVLSHVNIF